MPKSKFNLLGVLFVIFTVFIVAVKVQVDKILILIWTNSTWWWNC